MQPHQQSTSSQSQSRLWQCLSGAMTEHIIAPSAQPGHSPCFWNCSHSECNGEKGGWEGPAPHCFLLWRTQLHQLHLWQAQHHITWAQRLCMDGGQSWRRVREREEERNGDRILAPSLPCPAPAPPSLCPDILCSSSSCFILPSPMLAYQWWHM